MTTYRPACQTITWGDDQDKDFPGVFREIAAAGFSGVEIGFRRLESTPPETLKKILNDHGLLLIGSHIGGNLADLNQARGEWDVLTRVLDYLNTLDAKLLMLSGIHGKDANSLQHELDFFEKSAAVCETHGVSLLYHNHDWEFTSPQGIWEAMLKRKAFRFCPDVGWIYKGGRPVLDTLHQIKHRIGAIHFKDFEAMEPRMNPTTLGDGAAPLTEAAEWIKGHLSEPCWIVAEQDQTDIPTPDMARRNGAFLKNVLT